LYNASFSKMNVRKRLIAIFLSFLLVTAILTIRLFWIQVVQADDLYQKAWEQWNRSIPARSPRGSIYDRNGRLLAGSCTVETVVAIPAQIENPQETATLLSEVLEEDPARLKELLTRSRAAVYLKRKVDKDVAQKVRDLKLPGITFTTEGKRFYPQGTLASQLLGFVGMDQGWSGLEIMYEEELRGKEGHLYFPSDNRNRPIPHEVRRFVPPRDGKDLYLTIDDTIQYIVERELERALNEYGAKQAIALGVDPFTGEVLTVCSKPDFDPAQYSKYDSRYWKLTPFTGTFEPGSTFKLATLMAAVEEGIYNENERFYCSGSLEVAGTKIGCWTSSRGGHGSIDYLEAVLGSCNPAFMVLGQRLGKEKLFSYYKTFGFGARTGIDYPGEGSGIIFEPSQVGPLELATSSFGQGISVTPLQQVMAYAAIANGGYLMKPYVVKEIKDHEGNVVVKNEPKAVRQMISTETSRKIAGIMEKVVSSGSGINAYIEGFRVAGKTGTAQKVGPGGGYLHGGLILSFVGFAPMEKPQIILFIAVDGATRGSQWGSQICAPIFHRIMKDVLNYMGVQPGEDTVLPEGGVIEVPDLIDLTLDEAGQILDNKGLLLKTIGEGARIVDQTPKGGGRVPIHSRIIVYLDRKVLPTGKVVVPDLKGMTMEEAREILQWLGLGLNEEGSGTVVEQYPKSGTEMSPGREVSVVFRRTGSGGP